MTVSERCREALINAFDSFRSKESRDSSGYVERLENNFLPGVKFEMFESDFAEGSGVSLLGSPLSFPRCRRSIPVHGELVILA